MTLIRVSAPAPIVDDLLVFFKRLHDGVYPQMEVLASAKDASIDEVVVDLDFQAACRPTSPSDPDRTGLFSRSGRRGATAGREQVGDRTVIPETDCAACHDLLHRCIFVYHRVNETIAPSNCEIAIRKGPRSAAVASAFNTRCP